MTPEDMVDRSSKLLAQFDGLETGAVISILSTALQMAVCYGARSKEDATHMISCLMVDAEHDIPRQYDLVDGMRRMAKGDGKGERLQ
jgi:energy-converting hydrogenase A subunit M